MATFTGFIQGKEVAAGFPAATQVHRITHNGESYLPFMNRSFISFSFGERNIEDWNLIATFNDSGLQKKGYSSFEDIVSEYDILDGQLYWGTRHTANELSFTLATDGLQQKELDDFLHWFMPGKIRELILAEHPNRVIDARIKEPPDLELIPFEEATQIMIGGYPYKTSTTKYKGTINITFVMDQPFWHSKVNIFGYSDDSGIYHDTWIDANGQEISVYDDPDALKVALEDGIPISSMLSVSLLLGNNTFANLNSDLNAIIAMNRASITLTKNIEDNSLQLQSTDTIEERDEGTTFLFSASGNSISENMKWRAIAFSRLAASDVNNQIVKDDDGDIIYQKLLAISAALDSLVSTPTYTYTYVADDVNPRSLIATVESDVYISGAKIAGASMSKDTGLEVLNAGQYGYFYYAGTAPAKPKLTFTIAPTMANYYINCPANKYTNEVGYNTITIESVSKQEFKFTTPNLYTSYNQVIDIFNTIESGNSWESIREKIRANVNNQYVRTWANKVIDSIDAPDTGTGIINGSVSNTLKRRMSYMLKSKGENEEILKTKFVFDSETGTAVGYFGCRTYSGTAFPGTTDEWWRDSAGDIHLHDNSNALILDVGDMVRSDYIIIKDRNYPDDQGHIVAWEANRPDTYKYSHSIKHDVQQGIFNIFIEYQNMYL